MFVVASLLLGSFGLWIQAEDSSPARSLSGEWSSQRDSEDRIIMERKDNLIHVRETVDGRLNAEYTCSLDGKDCDYKEGGQKAKVSLWFNGPKLVELRTIGDHVIKRRFDLKPDGATLEVEVMPITPSGRNEVIAFSRSH